MKRHARAHKRSRRDLPMGELAAQKIVRIADEIAKEHGYAHGWIMEASRVLGVNYSVMHKLISGKTTSVGTLVISQVCRKIGCSTKDLME